MTPVLLAAALELSRLHGPLFAAYFLEENGIALEVALELLSYPPRRCSDQVSQPKLTPSPR